MKNEKPTLIILTPGFPADEVDSTCLPLLQSLITELKEEYSQLNLIALAFHYPFIRKIYNWKGIEVISFNSYKKRSLFKLPLFIRAWKKLKKIHDEENVIGILSLWCGECAWIGNKFSKRFGLKHYCWLWGQDARPGNKYVDRIKPSPDELIALSDFLQTEFEKNYSISPAHIILPGIDVKQYNLKNTVRDIDILGAGSLVPLKQYSVFVNVVNELKKSFPNIKAVICGKGPEEYKLQKQMESLNLKNNIVLAGELPHQEVIQLMQRSKILLHPSSYEGFGLVCMEALYAEAHVVSFCKPMNKEIENWHIVKDREDMIENCIQILRSSEPIFVPVLINEVADTSRQLMKLFGL